MIIQKIRSKAGFTLIELMVCIAIIAICAAIFIPVLASILTERDEIGDVEIVDQSEPEELEESQPAEKEVDNKL